MFYLCFSVGLKFLSVGDLVFGSKAMEDTHASVTTRCKTESKISFLETLEFGYR